MVQVLKLGGSVITEKAGEPRVREKVLARLTQEIAAADQPVAIVHGAGSFGHPLAAQAGLVSGVEGADDATAMARVHRDVRTLNLAVLGALEQAGLPAATLSPFGQLGCSDGKPGSWNLVPLHRCMDLGLTPVTHGDVVLDTVRGATVVSGDHLAAELTRFLRPERTLFVLDQDGVYDVPPQEGGTLMDAPSLADLEAAEEAAGTGEGADVTGGMAGKLAATRVMLRYGTEVAFLNGLEDGRLQRALEGDVQGTLVRPEEAP